MILGGRLVTAFECDQESHCHGFVGWTPVLKAMDYAPPPEAETTVID